MLPAMLFLILCGLQLTQLQQARLLVEYAAFSAARTGIVHDLDNGDAGDGSNGPMHEAAVLALLPSVGRTDSAEALVAAAARFKAEDVLLSPLGLSRVRVAVLNPRRGDFDRLGKHLAGREIDFDDARPDAAAATLLSLQVRYLYELRIPFANRMIQAIWLAAVARRGKAGKLVGLGAWRGWDMTGPRLLANDGPDAVVAAQAAAAAQLELEDGIPGGLNLTSLSLLASQGRFFLPLDAWFTLRMQSNPFARWAAP